MSEIQTEKQPRRNIRVDANLFAAVWCFVEKNHEREFLRGVLIEPHPEGNGVLLIGSNGHTMGVAHDPNGRANGTYICPAPQRMKKAMRKMKHANLLHFVGAEAHLTTTPQSGDENECYWDNCDVSIPGTHHALSTIKPAIDGQIIKWRKVASPDAIPTDQINLRDFAKSTWTANPKYITQIQNVAEKLCGGLSILSVTFYPSKKDDVTVFKFLGIENFIGFIMPTRREGGDHSKALNEGIPSWIGNASTDATEASNT